MSDTNRSPTLNESAASSQIDNFEDAQITLTKNFARTLLKSRIFLGRYVERRLVNEHIGYRDIVLISPAEVDLKRDLSEVQYKLQKLYPASHWIGITETGNIGLNPDGICIWTEINSQPFGAFWFQIVSLKCREVEIMVAVKCLRHISDAFLEMEPILTGTARKAKASTITSPEGIADLNETFTDFVSNVKNVVTPRNLLECLRFLFALFMAIITGSTSFIEFLGNFVLALIREMSLFVKNSTPMFLGILDFFSKIVGGFYILLAMIFKQSTPVPTNGRSIEYHKRSPRKYAQYNDGQID